MPLEERDINVLLYMLLQEDVNVKIKDYIQKNKSNLIYVVTGVILIISLILALMLWHENRGILETLIVLVIPIVILVLDSLLLFSLKEKLTCYSLVTQYLFLPLVFSIYFYIVSASSVVYQVTNKPFLLLFFLSIFLAIIVFILYLIRKSLLNNRISVRKIWYIIVKYIAFILIEIVLYLFVFLANFTYQ